MEQRNKLYLATLIHIVRGINSLMLLVHALILDLWTIGKI